MIINTDIYECSKCRELYFFDTDKKPYDLYCANCKCELNFLDNADRDTDLAEKVKNTPPYDPTKDPDSPYYIPVIECPYCHSTNTSKISAASRVFSTGIFGLGSKKVGKQWHCNKCEADF